MRWSCLQFNVLLLLPESYRRLPAATRGKPLSPPPTRPGRILENNFTRYVVRNQAETAEDAESTGEHHRIQQRAIFRFFPHFVEFLTVSFSCGIVYSRVKRTPGSEKSSCRHISSNGKSKRKCWYTYLVYVPGTYISPFVLALEGGENSNPSRKEKLFLRTANPRQDSNNYVHG